jgi:cell division protein FtsB
MPSARPATAAPNRSRNPRTARPRIASRGPRVRVRWDRLGRIGLLVVLVVVLGLYVEHTLSYFSTRSQADAQHAIVQQLARENHGLEQQQKALSQPATIIRDARALGMVAQGERPYVITGLPDR